jgi:hypothetical protein
MLVAEWIKHESERTREAIALRLTMMIGHTGRYLETRRAVVPLRIVSDCQIV